MQGEDKFRYWWMNSVDISTLVITDANDHVIAIQDELQQFNNRHIRDLTNWLKEKGNFEYEELVLVPL
jgi:hypothetical protein